MGRYRRKIAAGALVCGLGLTAAACSSSSSPAASPATTEAGGSGATASSQTPAVTAIPVLTGTGTTVDLDPSTLAALTSLGVKPAPYGTATLSGANITFPITSGYAEIHSDKSFKPGYVIGSIEHDGSGLTLSKGSTVVTLKNFVVDPGNSMLYGTVGSKPGVPLAFLDGSNLQVTVDGSTVHLDGTKVELTQTAASALDQAFGTTAVKAGLELGVAHIAATGTANQFTDTTTQIPRVTGQQTSVDLDAATLAALTHLGVKPGTLGSATLSGSSVSFPITGGVAVIHSDKSYKPGYIDGVVLHQGSGLSFTKGATTVAATDFVVNPGDSMLYATVGKAYNFPLFFLDGSALQVTTSGGAVHLDGTKVELTPQAATALNAAFGTTALQPYTLVGVAHIVAS
jgi:hypothetical protein